MNDTKAGGKAVLATCPGTAPRRGSQRRDQLRPGATGQLRGELASGIHSVANQPPCHPRHRNQDDAVGYQGNHGFGQDPGGGCDAPVLELVDESAGGAGVDVGSPDEPDPGHEPLRSRTQTPPTAPAQPILAYTPTSETNHGGEAIGPV